MRAYICTHGKPGIHGEKIREFVHSPQIEPNLYVWKNRPLSIEEHASAARKVSQENADLFPYSRFEMDPRDVSAALSSKEQLDRIEALEQQLAQAGAELLKLRSKRARSAEPQPV